MAGAIAALGGSMLGQMGSSVASGIGSKITDKIFGVPKVPSPPSGVEVGQWEKDRMDVLFPNLTEYQRAGISSPGGDVVSGNVSAGNTGANIKSQQQAITKEKMFDFGLQAQAKTMDYNNQRRLNDQNNKASIIASGANMGPEAVQSMLDYYNGETLKDFDSKNRRERELLDSEKHRNYYGSNSSAAVTGLKPYAESIGKGIGDFYNLIRNHYGLMNHRSTGPNTRYLNSPSRRRLGAFGRLLN